MPTYLYKCPECGREWDFVHGMSEHPQPECPTCDVRLERQITSPGGVRVENGTPKFHRRGG